MFYWRSATRALIVGAAGQDGSYLAELLLASGDKILGILRPGSAASPRLSAVSGRIRLIDADLTDAASVDRAISATKPDEVYNFAAQSFMPATWKEPELTGEIMGRGVTRLLESLVRHAPKARFYQASSAEMFGRPAQSPQNEETPPASTGGSTSSSTRACAAPPRPSSGGATPPRPAGFSAGSRGWGFGSSSSRWSAGTSSA